MFNNDVYDCITSLQSSNYTLIIYILLLAIISQNTNNIKYLKVNILEYHINDFNKIENQSSSLTTSEGNFIYRNLYVSKLNVNK